jgi:hypothetical protein
VAGLLVTFATASALLTAGATSAAAAGKSANQATAATPAVGIQTTGTVCALSPDRQAVYRYNGTGTSWTRVGGPASHIVPCN